MKIVFRYENNLTNASLFANLTLDGLPQLVPGRLFTTRMPRDIVKDPQERKDFVHKCKVNNLVRITLQPCPKNWGFHKHSVIIERKFLHQFDKKSWRTCDSMVRNQTFES